MINLNIIPTVLEKTYDGERVFDLYSKLLNERIIFLNGATQLSQNPPEYQYTGLTKRKSFSSFEAGNFFGNSYSFRVNLKTLSVYDNTDSIIDGYELGVGWKKSSQS